MPVPRLTPGGEPGGSSMERGVGVMTIPLEELRCVADMAPLVRNTEPWSPYAVGGDRVELRVDWARSLELTDPRHCGQARIGGEEWPSSSCDVNLFIRAGTPWTSSGSAARWSLVIPGSKS